MDRRCCAGRIRTSAGNKLETTLRVLSVALFGGGIMLLWLHVLSVGDTTWQQETVTGKTDLLHGTTKP